MTRTSLSTQLHIANERLETLEKERISNKSYITTLTEQTNELRREQALLHDLLDILGAPPRTVQGENSWEQRPQPVIARLAALLGRHLIGLTRSTQS